MSACCDWCGEKLQFKKKHKCKKEEINRSIKNYSPKSDKFLWMKSWLQAYDAENKGLEGKKIMDWIWRQGTSR